jgi:hypothetical protein
MSDFLGLDHPLTRASDALDTTVKQLLVVVALFAGGLAASLEHAHWGRDVVIASGLVLAGFALAAWVRAQARRDRALDLILEGRESLPLSVVQRECRRLAALRTRRSLATTLQSMIEETLQRRALRLRSARPLLSRALIAEAQDEMRAIARLLLSESVRIRGVALVERVVTQGTSPLYGCDAAALRSEFARARVLLTGD